MAKYIQPGRFYRLRKPKKTDDNVPIKVLERVFVAAHKYAWCQKVGDLPYSQVVYGDTMRSNRWVELSLEEVAIYKLS